MTRARCPECCRAVDAFVHHRRLIFVHHYRNGRSNGGVCDGSGWIVEDTEVIST